MKVEHLAFACLWVGTQANAASVDGHWEGKLTLDGKESSFEFDQQLTSISLGRKKLSIFRMTSPKLNKIYTAEISQDQGHVYFNNGAFPDLTPSPNQEICGASMLFTINPITHELTGELRKNEGPIPALGMHTLCGDTTAFATFKAQLAGTSTGYLKEGTLKMPLIDDSKAGTSWPFSAVIYSDNILGYVADYQILSGGSGTEYLARGAAQVTGPQVSLQGPWFFDSKGQISDSRALLEGQIDGQDFFGTAYDRDPKSGSGKAVGPFKIHFNQ